MDDLTNDLLTQLSSSPSMYLLILTISVVIFFVLTTLTNQETWDKYGVKHVTMGRAALTDFNRAVAELMSEHGDTIGTSFQGLMLFTRDVELLRHILVKDFNNFVDRTPLLTTRTPLEVGLFFVNGQDWRRLRHLMSPSFSTGKLKYVAETSQDTARKLAGVIEESAMRDRLVPIKYLSGQYTSEVIARSAFGVLTDCLGKEDDEFTHHAKRIIKIRNRVMNFVMLVLYRFHSLHVFLVKKLNVGILDLVSAGANDYFSSVIHATVAQRLDMERRGQARPKDFLQSMIVAKTQGDEEAAKFTYDTTAKSWEQLPKTMTDRELIGQSMLVIFAGLESTSTSLQMCLFMMAKHPDIQEKVFQEIQAVVSSESPTYEELGKLKYTEMVINETLRLYPPLILITRQAVSTYHYKNITIPKGAGVMLSLETIMMDSRNYPDPTKFDPERFSEENKAKRDYLTFLPFGQGPRQCIGMRLAYLELKVGLVHVLRKIKFELNDRTEPRKGEELEIKCQGILVIEKPIQLQAILRK